MTYRKIEDSKLTAVANAIRTKLGTTDTMTPNEMPSFIEAIGIGVVPNYWKSYLDSKVTEIDAALNSAGENKSAFLWYTDAHWVENFWQSPMILKYLSKHTGMKKTFFGGDIAVESSGEIDVLTAWRERVKDIPNHHSVIGNHDNNVAELTTAEDRADFFLKQTSDMSVGTDATNGKMYYYIDNYLEKTRYICLSTGRMWTTTDEIPWCIETLNSTPKNWHIVIVSHLWLNNDYLEDGATLNTTPPDYSQSYLDLFDAYNYRLTGTTRFGSMAYDFTAASAKVEFIIGGHIHKDYDFATAKGTPVILTECDGRWERDANSVATQGTTTENCVYAIIADYTAKVVKVINVGRGSTRTLSIPDVVMYTNWIKESINSDGTPYVGLNGEDGYKSNYRLNSSGAEAAYNNHYITGFIPIRTGDVVRFKNLDYLKFDTGEAQTKFAFYKEDFTFHAQSPHTASSLPSAVWSAVYREDGNVKQVTIPHAMGQADIRYMRVCARLITDNSIITVNEEIG